MPWDVPAAALVADALLGLVMGCPAVGMCFDAEHSTWAMHLAMVLSTRLGCVFRVVTTHPYMSEDVVFGFSAKWLH
jgi:hypothetical protein